MGRVLGLDFGLVETNGKVRVLVVVSCLSLAAQSGAGRMIVPWDFPVASGEDEAKAELCCDAAELHMPF